MLLYAGIIIKYYLKNFNYSSLNTKVTILKLIIKSAGFKKKAISFNFNTSETIYNKTSSIKKYRK